MLETKREIVVSDDGGLVLGRELAIAAGMIAVEMGIDDVFDRLAAVCLNSVSTWITASSPHAATILPPDCRGRWS